MYMADNNGYFPTDRYSSATNITDSWMARLAPYYGGNLGAAADNPKVAIAQIKCPSANLISNWANVYPSYGVNIADENSDYNWEDGYGLCSDYRKGTAKSRLGSSVPDSAGTMMLIEANNTYATPGLIGGAVVNRHSDKLNLTMVDGHVESEDIVKYNAKTTKGFWTIIAGDDN
jgi:prepilin-type processing-associated H-X9-DG protein